MRGYAGLYIFCAVLTFVCSGASLAADGAAEYRAPVTGVKLGPVQPAQPEPPAAPGPPSVEKPAAPQLPGPQPGQSVGQQPNQQAGQPVAGPSPALQTAASGQPTPWPSAGGMAPYSSFGSLPGPAEAPAPAPAPSAASVPNPAAVPPPAPAPGFAPEYAPGYGPGYAPYPAPAPGWQGQGDSFVSGTGQLQGENFNDRGIATQYRDPQTGDIVTSVVPPAPPDQQNYGTFFVAPQIYPDGNPWGPNPYGPMPRPGGPSWPGQQNMPSVIWQPAPQPDHNRHRHDDRRHDDRPYDDRRYDDRQYDNRRYDDRPHDGRYDGPRREQHDSRDGGYNGPNRPRDNSHDQRGDDRYNPRPGNQGDSQYDPRGADRGRDGRERR